VWLRSPCLGLCDQAPAAMLQIAGENPVDRLFGGVTAASAAKVIGMVCIACCDGMCVT